jgi:6-pyruvoyl-tetrahydropterin synthase
MNRLKKTYTLHQGEKIYGYGAKVVIEDKRPVPKDKKELTTEKQTILEDVRIGAKGDEIKLWMGAIFTPREDRTRVMNDEYRITKDDFLENITGFSLISFEDNVAKFIMNYSETEEKNREILEEMDFIDLQLEEDFTPFDERRSETFKIRITDSLTEAIEDSNEEALTKEIKAFLLDKRVPVIYDLFENLTRISSSILNPSILVTDTNIEFKMPTILKLSTGEKDEEDNLIYEDRSHLVISADIHLTINGRFIIPRVTIPSLSGPASKLKQSGLTQRARGELIQHIRSSIKELEHAIGELI